jgi:flavin reductase (DIM6/NTAB) family NADH-FMN oxidoreductase RutF
MKVSKEDIEKMDRIRRLNLVNSLSGYKSANLIGTRSESGISNLAIVSSVLHLSSSPAVIGFMQRPTSVPRHTYANIRETGCFTINHVHEEIMDKAHYTSAKFDPLESEFETCGFSEEYLDGFQAPFVKESPLKLAVTCLEEYAITASNTILVVGGIQAVYLPEAALQEDGHVDLNQMNTVCISGLNHYHQVDQIATFGYARPGIFPVNSYLQK